MGAQSDDAYSNLGKGKEASSFLDISCAKFVPRLVFVNIFGIFEHGRQGRKGR